MIISNKINVNLLLAHFTKVSCLRALTNGHSLNSNTCAQCERVNFSPTTCPSNHIITHIYTIAHQTTCDQWYESAVLWVKYPLIYTFPIYTTIQSKCLSDWNVFVCSICALAIYAEYRVRSANCANIGQLLVGDNCLLKLIQFGDWATTPVRRSVIARPPVRV